MITNEMFYSPCGDPCDNYAHGTLHCLECGSRPLPGWWCGSCLHAMADRLDADPGDLVEIICSLA